MDGHTYRWILPEAVLSTPDLGSGFEPVVARFLIARGYVDPEAIAAYTNPQLTALHDPSLLPGLDRAASRILEAARAGKPIVIYGDYDVDGITATAILFHLVRAVAPNAKISTYVPHRLDEGYGLNVEAISALVEQGASLIVTVDCGVTSMDPVRTALHAGIDLIITDHHQLPPDGSPLPPAYCIVHPDLPGSSYPFAELCGAGVAFKLAWRIATLAKGAGRVGPELRELLLDLMALAALGTIADVVPLVDENRVIARFGLRRLRSTQLVGLQAMLKQSGLTGEHVDAEQVGFVLAPKLNAIGRLGHAAEAIEMLTVASPERAAEIAQTLAHLNDQRKRTERVIVEQANQMAQDAGMTSESSRAIVLAHEDWHPGVVGICCSRLVGLYHRPTILLCLDGDTCKGSGRSIDGFDLHGALVTCSEHLQQFGGHPMAAGLTLKTANLDSFAEAFRSIASQRLTDENMERSLTVDCEATAAELSPLATRQLQALGPFGRGNRSPRILLRNVRVSRRPETFGARGAHLSVHIRSGDREMRLVGWRWGARHSKIASGARVDIVVEPKLNSWNGRTTVEPTLCDLRIARP